MQVKFNFFCISEKNVRLKFNPIGNPVCIYSERAQYRGPGYGHHSEGPGPGHEGREHGPGLCGDSPGNHQLHLQISNGDISGDSPLILIKQ